MRSNWLTSLRPVSHDVKVRGSGTMLHMRFRYCNTRTRRSRRPSAQGSGLFKPLRKQVFSFHVVQAFSGQGLAGEEKDERVHDYDTLAVALEGKCCSLSSYSSSKPIPAVAAPSLM